MIHPCYRGEVYYAVLGCGMGSEQSGVRPVVILQNDIGNKFSPTTIIAPISGQIATKASLPTHYCLEAQAGLLEPSMILLEQIRTIDKQRLGRRLGRLSEEHMHGISRAVKISLGLIDTPPQMVLCLCGVCASQFRLAQSHALRRVDPLQVQKEICTYCNRRWGFDYEVV